MRRAILLALCIAWGPLHIISDSRWGSDFLNALVSSGGYDDKVSHADLWAQVFEQVGRLKGQVRCTWVPSHTKIRDVEDNLISYRDHILNTGADILAARGAASIAPEAGIIRKARRTRFLAKFLLPVLTKIHLARESGVPLVTRRAGFTETEIELRKQGKNLCLQK